MSPQALTPTVLMVENTLSRPLELLVEPWFEQAMLEPGECRWLVFVSTAVGSPQIRFGDSKLTVYGWEGAEFRMFRWRVKIPDFSLPLNKMLECELKDRRKLLYERLNDDFAYLQGQLDSDFALGWSAEPHVSGCLKELLIVAFNALASGDQRIDVAVPLARIASSMYLSRGLWLHDEEGIIDCIARSSPEEYLETFTGVSVLLGPRSKPSEATSEDLRKFPQPEVTGSTASTASRLLDRGDH